MQIQVNDTAKLVSVWLTNAEQTPEVEKGLKSMYAEYKAKKYKVAVFRSGNDDDLSGLTGALLKDNKFKLFKDDTGDGDVPIKVVADKAVG
jgi:hypothetical protein